MAPVLPAGGHVVTGPVPVVPPIDPQPSVYVSSSAEALSADLTLDGIKNELGPIGGVSGRSPPAYDKMNSIASLNKTLRLEPGCPADTTLQIQATKVVTTAASSGVGLDAISADADTSIGASDFVLTSSPLGPGGTLTLLDLSVSAKFIRSSSDASDVFGAKGGSVAGAASFGSLDIGGNLIGKTLTFSGDAAANTVLFSSPTVTVTLDKQTVSDLLPPQSMVGQTPATIATDAIDISLHNAKLLGTTMSGNFVIGETSANVAHPFAVAE